MIASVTLTKATLKGKGNLEGNLKKVTRKGNVNR